MIMVELYRGLCQHINVINWVYIFLSSDFRDDECFGGNDFQNISYAAYH